MAKDFIGEQGVIQTPARTFDFSDESGIGADDGTPIKAEMVMQLHAVTQKLMADAGFSFNNLPENAVSQAAGDQQIFEALVSKINTLVQNASSAVNVPNAIAKRSSLGEIRGAVSMATIDAYLSGGSADSKSIIPFGSATIPTGWFLCNGATVSRTSYPLLFAAIGTTWGVGDGTTTFTLPDLRHRMITGAYPSASSGEYFIRPDGNTFTTQVLTGQYVQSAAALNRYAAGVSFIIRAL